MLERFRSEKINRSHSDLGLVAAIVLLSGLGLCALFSVSYGQSLKLYGDPSFMTKKQLLYFAVFGGWAFFLTRFRIESIRSIIPSLMILNFIFLALPLFPVIGLEINGGHRWVNMGKLGTFQPSEWCKIVIILYIAYIIDKKEREGKSQGLKFLIPNIILLACSILVVLQRDISTALFILALGISLIFLGGCSFSQILPAPLVLFSVLCIYMLNKSYSRSRLLTYLGISQDPDGVGYQIRRALSAFSDSGFFGVGIGANMSKDVGVPEAHSDFILPAIARDVGYLGILLIFVLVIFLAVKGFLIAWRLKEDTFSFLVANGITIALVVQFFLNVGISAKMFPTTGIPLPFFSAGGSSLFATLTMCGILVGLSAKVREELA